MWPVCPCDWGLWSSAAHLNVIGSPDLCLGSAGTEDVGGYSHAPEGREQGLHTFSRADSQSQGQGSQELRLQPLLFLLTLFPPFTPKMEEQGSYPIRSALYVPIHEETQSDNSILVLRLVPNTDLHGT